MPRSVAVKSGANLGPVAAGDLGASQQGANADSSPSRPTSPHRAWEPVDEFDGAALNPCRWAGVVGTARPPGVGRRGRLGFAPSRATSTEAERSGRATLLQPVGRRLDRRDRVDHRGGHRLQLAGLLMFSNDDDYAEADVIAYDDPGSPVDTAPPARRRRRTARV